MLLNYLSTQSTPQIDIVKFKTHLCCFLIDTHTRNILYIRSRTRINPHTRKYTNTRPYIHKHTRAHSETHTHMHVCIYIRIHCSRDIWLYSWFEWHFFLIHNFYLSPLIWLREKFGIVFAYNHVSCSPILNISDFRSVCKWR